MAALDPPELPAGYEYLFTWICELDRSRGYDMNGPRRVTYLEIDAWARMTRRSPQPHEVEALFTLDAALLMPDPPSEGAA